MNDLVVGMTVQFDFDLVGLAVADVLGGVADGVVVIEPIVPENGSATIRSVRSVSES